MNTHTAVEIFLGKHIDVPSEQQFLARLQRDLRTLGVSTRILANLQVGRLGDRQVDFVVITDQRTMVIELKPFGGPIVSGPRNGPWSIQIGAGIVRELGNPLTQVLSAAQHFSDELHTLADYADLPSPRRAGGPRGPKYYSDLDAVVCAYPAVPEGSTWETIKHTSLVGYDEMRDRLQKRGPSLQWSAEHWDRFARHLNLYRADEDTPESIVGRAGAAVIDAYSGLYREAHTNTVVIADTAVVVDGTLAARPDVSGMLTGGSTVLLHGTSGTGKTLWAQNIAVELAAAGHLPIWIEADMCDGPFLTACAQAIAPYTALNVNELLKAADAAGRAVVFVVDDYSKIAGEGRRRLLDGLRTVRVRATGRGLLVTDQQADQASQLSTHTDVELLVPGDADRRAVLAAYGHAELIGCCDAFATPLELSVAARCADDLGSELSHAELFDTYVDRVVAGDHATRSGLQAIAARMAADLRPFQRRGDVTRYLRRQLGMSDEQLRRVFDCDLLVTTRGRIAFRHEQFERFLAAEAMLLSDADPVLLARRLNSPSASALRRDTIALESDPGRLETLLSLCENAGVLVDATIGQLGAAAAEVMVGVLVDALNDACAQTAASDVKLRSTADAFGGCEWEIPSPLSRAQIAQLSAVGELLAEGTWTSGVDVLLCHTDELCARAVQAADRQHANAFAGHVFAATYVFAQVGALPVSPLVVAATNHFHFSNDDADGVAGVVDRLLPDGVDPGPGALYIAAHILRDPRLPLRADVITRCVESVPYHLRAAGLNLAQDRSGRLTEGERDEIVAQISALSTNNLALSTAQVEALAALGGVQPAKSQEDIEREIRATLTMKGDPTGDKLAYGIISSQFENEIVGPYYEVVSELPEDERIQLLAMALDGCEYGWMTDTFILYEIEDLTVPEVRAAVSRYIARFVPKESVMPQEAMQGTMRAVALLTRAALPLPKSAVGKRDPAWQRVLELMSAAAGDDDQALAKAWVTFATEHPYSVASLLAKFRCGLRMHQDDGGVGRLESAMPPAAVDALLAALKRPDRVQPVAGHDYRLQDDIVARLARIGDRRAAETLRRFANDPEIGEQAAEAVRAIEARGS